MPKATLSLTDLRIINKALALLEADDHDTTERGTVITRADQLRAYVGRIRAVRRKVWDGLSEMGDKNV